MSQTSKRVWLGLALLLTLIATYLAPPPEAEAAVSIRTDSSGDIVEEYRMNGRIYMVKVRPQRGIPYTLQDTNGDGRLDDSDGEGPVRPVYYTLYEWD